MAAIIQPILQANRCASDGHESLLFKPVNIVPRRNGTKLRRLFLCRAEFIRPLAVGGYPHRGYIRDDRWYGNVLGRMNSTLQWVK